MMSWKCPKVRGKTKSRLDLNNLLRTCHVKYMDYYTEFKLKVCNYILIILIGKTFCIVVVS